jgi:hypothetical protein
MRASRMRENAKDMKKSSSKRPKVSGRTARATPRRKSSGHVSGDLRPDYEFDYSKSRPNRFAERLAGTQVAVVLDPDVATVFQSAEAVNTFLRSAISAMPQDGAGKKPRVSARRLTRD